MAMSCSSSKGLRVFDGEDGWIQRRFCEKEQEEPSYAERRAKGKLGMVFWWVKKWRPRRKEQRHRLGLTTSGATKEEGA